MAWDDVVKGDGAEVGSSWDQLFSDIDDTPVELDNESSVGAGLKGAAKSLPQLAKFAGGMLLGRYGAAAEAGHALQDIQRQYSDGQITRLEDIGTQDGVLTDTARFLGYQIGAAVPSLAMSAVTGGVGGLAGGMATKKLLGNAAASQVKKGRLAGVLAGTAATSVPLSQGEIGSKIYQETGEVNAGVAGLGGLVAGSLDVIGPARALAGFGLGGAVKDATVGTAGTHIAREMAKTAGVEGVTEAGQELIGQGAAEVANPDADHFDVMDVLNAGVSGFVGSSPMGLASGVGQVVNERRSWKDLPQEVRQTLPRLKQYESHISAMSEKYGVDANLVRAVIAQESRGKRKAKSHAGAQGLMQLMPGTAGDMGVTDAYDAAQNIEGGVKYLAMQLKKYKGDVSLALAAYNAGPGNVDKHGGVPPFAETQDYVKKVGAFYEALGGERVEVPEGAVRTATDFASEPIVTEDPAPARADPEMGEILEPVEGRSPAEPSSSFSEPSVDPLALEPVPRPDVELVNPEGFKRSEGSEAGGLAVATETRPPMAEGGEYLPESPENSQSEQKTNAQNEAEAQNAEAVMLSHPEGVFVDSEGNPAVLPDQAVNPVGNVVNSGLVEPDRGVESLQGDEASLEVLQGNAFEQEASPEAVALDTAANESAESPLNDLPEPTQAQKEAGNYKKGKYSLHGLPLSIENPKGSLRKGVDEHGKPWESEMQAHYGYVKGTEGADGDQVDVFLGDQATNPQLSVYVVDQVDPKTGKFDEHKVMIGYPDEQSAREGYLANYDEGWQGIGGITQMPIGEFKTWVASKRAKKPVSALPEVDNKAAKAVNNTGKVDNNSDKANSRDVVEGEVTTSDVVEPESTTEAPQEATQEFPEFIPTHELPTGEQVIKHPEDDGVWIDVHGDEWEGDASPVESVDVASDGSTAGVARDNTPPNPNVTEVSNAENSTDEVIQNREDAKSDDVQSLANAVGQQFKSGRRAVVLSGMDKITIGKALAEVGTVLVDHPGRMFLRKGLPDAKRIVFTDMGKLSKLKNAPKKLKEMANAGVELVFVDPDGKADKALFEVVC